MWLFGQVWFACVVGFVVGVGLTWLWQVRPLNRRVEDLERTAQLADRPAPQASRPAEDYRGEDLRPGFGNTTYDSQATAIAAPSGVGFDTGSGRPGLDEMFEPERAEPTRVDAPRAHSVDDYVEQLVQEYQGDAPAEHRGWAARAPEAVESWRPGALGSRLDQTENTNDTATGEPDQPSPQELTSYQPVQHRPEPETAPPAEESTQLQPRPFINSYGASGEFGGRGNADEQYLEYLRSGGLDADNETAAPPAPPAAPELESEPEAVRDYVAQDYSGYPQEGYPAEQQGGYAEQHSGYPAAEQPETAGYQGAGYDQTGYDQAGYQQAGYAEAGYEQTAYQQAPHEQAGPEHAGYEQGEHTAYEQGEYEDAGYEQAEGYEQAAAPHAEAEHAAEVTSVLPFIDDEAIEDEPVEAEHIEAEHVEAEPETLAEQTVVNQQPLIEQEDEQGVPAQHDYFAPEPLAGLVRPHSSGGGAIASAQPFQLGGQDRSERGAQQGQLTPIEEGGWQPFAKPFDEQAPADDAGQQWHDDWSDEPVNGAHADAAHADTAAAEETEPAERTGPVAAKVIEEADHQSNHQAEPEAAAESTTTMPPVTDDYEPAPASRHQLFDPGDSAEAEQDYPADDYDEQAEVAAPSRSLFEPVIEPELPTGYLTPVAPPEPQRVDQSAEQGRQQTAPHPIRVRTGVAQPNPQPNRPVRAPAGSAGWQSGPFGPGSALPLPDGSAPSPQFRVKARTSSMVFHTENSPFYDRLEPQVWFTSQEDAQRAGFTSWERPRTW